MKVYQSKEIKNIALLGNDGAGKTTLTETLLYEAGVISRRGRITLKNTVSDYFPVEQEYGYSVFSTVFHTEWNGKKLNFIDCPGSDDFVGAAITALNVTDTAVLLINGQRGPEVGTQNHFRYTEKLGKPVIFLINQLDSEKCDYHNCVEKLRETYGSKVVQVQYPLNEGPDFNSLIDVLLMKKYSWKPEGGAPIIEDIPASELDKATELHAALIEAAAENDEALMEKFFETESLTEDEMREGIRKGLVTRSIYPVFCVCATKDMGVRIFSVGLAFVLVLFGFIQYFMHCHVDSLADFSFRDYFVNFFNFHHEGGNFTPRELSLLFTIFVFMQFWNIFNAKAYRTGQSALKGFLNKDVCRGFGLTLLIIFVGQILIVSFGGEMFNVVPLPLGDWLRIIGFTSIILWVGEVERWIKKMKSTKIKGLS